MRRRDKKQNELQRTCGSVDVGHGTHVLGTDQNRKKKIKMKNQKRIKRKTNLRIHFAGTNHFGNYILILHQYCREKNPKRGKWILNWSTFRFILRGLEWGTRSQFHFFWWSIHFTNLNLCFTWNGHVKCGTAVLSQVCRLKALFDVLMRHQIYLLIIEIIGKKTANTFPTPYSCLRCNRFTIQVKTNKISTQQINGERRIVVCFWFSNSSIRWNGAFENLS